MTDAQKKPLFLKLCDELLEAIPVEEEELREQIDGLSSNVFMLLPETERDYWLRLARILTDVTPDNPWGNQVINLFNTASRIRTEQERKVH